MFKLNEYICISGVIEQPFKKSPLSGVRLISYSMPAGFPSPAADYADQKLDINDYLVRNNWSTFMFTVKGDSMLGASIEDEDKVVVDRSINPKNNDIVIAVLDGEYTIKRLYRRGKKIELKPENDKYKPIQIESENTLEIWGVVVGVIRKYSRR